MFIYLVEFIAIVLMFLCRVLSMALIVITEGERGLLIFTLPLYPGTFNRMNRRGLFRVLLAAAYDCDPKD